MTKFNESLNYLHKYILQDTHKTTLKFNSSQWFDPATTYALSFYVTKTVLVGPKRFWSDQIDLDLTLMIWS